jgi:hypothetical protein
MTINAAIVTNCTQRKCEQKRIDVAQLPLLLDVYQLAQTWRHLVSLASPAGPARSVYQGRSIADTAAAASYLRSKWYIVSAGLGLVRSDKQVPAYECTVAAGSDLGCRLKLSGATEADWWNALTAPQSRSLSRLIARTPTLLALPGSYLRMVHDDLARVPVSKVGQLRVFTSTAGAQFVPDHLAICVMPYDDRLESVPNYAGTQSDFAQRALRHFVETLGAATLPLEKARAKVSGALARRPRRPRSMGLRMSDDDIQQVLTAQWSRHGGRSTRLLRYLRDEACISCEQKRFRRLWRELATELQA